MDISNEKSMYTAAGSFCLVFETSDIALLSLQTSCCIGSFWWMGSISSHLMVCGNPVKCYIIKKLRLHKIIQFWLYLKKA